MKKELEVKIPGIDEERMRGRLAQLGGYLEFDGAIRTASYEVNEPGRTHIYLCRQPDGGGLLALADPARGRLLRAHVHNHAEAIEILTTMGLEGRGDAWSAPRRLRRLAERGMRLRLRRLVDGERRLDYGQFTLKTNKEVDTIKRMNEIETDLDDYAAAREILLQFGMREFRAYDKERAEYHLAGGIKVAIDRIPGVPVFAEVEGPDDESIERTVNALGHSMAETSTMTGRELRELYRR